MPSLCAMKPAMWWDWTGEVCVAGSQTWSLLRMNIRDPPWLPANKKKNPGPHKFPPNSFKNKRRQLSVLQSLHLFSTYITNFKGCHPDWMNDTECSSKLASSLQNGVRVAMKALTIAVPVVIVASFAAQLTALKDMDAERMVKMLGDVWR